VTTARASRRKADGSEARIKEGPLLSLKGERSGPGIGSQFSPVGNQNQAGPRCSSTPTPIKNPRNLAPEHHRPAHIPLTERTFQGPAQRQSRTPWIGL
jgi:hypothetical protein